MNGSVSPRSTQIRANASTLRPSASFNDARHSRRQTLPAVFPKETERVQLSHEVSLGEVNESLERLEQNYINLKNKIEERRTLLTAEMNSQFGCLQEKLDEIREKRRARLIGLLRDENADNDVQNSESAGILYTGNGHHSTDIGSQNGFYVGREHLTALSSFEVRALDQSDPDEMDFLGGYRQLYRMTEGRLLYGGSSLYGRDGRQMRQSFGGSLGGTWSPGSVEGHSSNVTADSGFNMFDSPVRQRGASLSSGVFSSTPFSPFQDANFTPSSAFGGGMPLSPFHTPDRNVFSFSDSRSTGGIGLSSQSQHSPPPSMEYYSGNSFSGVPRALHGVPEGNGMENTESNAAANILNPTNLNKLLNLADRVQRIGLDGNGRNPFGNGNGSGGVRRTNSNPGRRRSRRASCPENSRGWGQMYHGPRNGYYEENDNVFADLGENGYLPEEITGRPGHNMRELEIRYRFGEVGCSEGQMNAPHGFCLGAKTRNGGQEIIVADTNNHRIQFFDEEGRFLRQFGRSGKQSGQLFYPRKVAYFQETNKLVVCDRGSDRSRLQIFDRNGNCENVISLDFVAIVAGMTTYRHWIVVVDSVNPSCIVMSQAGEIRHTFSCKEDMKEPSDVVVTNNLFYICDFKGHCVCTYDGKGNFMARVGGKDIINFPNGIDVTLDGQILVGDSHGNRFHVAMYDANGKFLSEYECPHMKVSRCCGLVLTPQGHIVTIAKNNNFVLILERLDREVQGSSEGDGHSLEFQNQVPF